MYVADVYIIGTQEVCQFRPHAFGSFYSLFTRTRARLLCNVANLSCHLRVIPYFRKFVKYSHLDIFSLTKTVSFLYATFAKNALCKIIVMS